MQIYFHRLERLSKGTSNVGGKVHILTLNKLKKNCVEETGDELSHFLKCFMMSKENSFISVHLMANKVCMSINFIVNFRHFI